MIFDSWGGVLADGAFQHFSLAYTAARAGAAQARARRRSAFRASSSPRAAACGWTQMQQLDCDVRGPGLDREPGAGARRASATSVALQGNLDPNVLFAPPDADRGRSASPCSTASARRSAPTARWDGHIFNLGHGISQHTPPENVAVLVDAVHAHSRSMRAHGAETVQPQSTAGRAIQACICTISEHSGLDLSPKLDAAAATARAVAAQPSRIHAIAR